MKINYLVIVIASFIAGCGSAPKSPQEFRQSVTNGSTGMEKSSFVVKRSLSDLAKTYESKSKECLHVTVEREVTIRHPNGAQGKGGSSFIAYSAKVNSTIKQLELNVQVKITGNALKTQEEPEGGYYLFSAEVIPVNNTQSKVTLYYHNRYKNLLEAVQGWSTGQNLKCPDLAKDI